MQQSISHRFLTHPTRAHCRKAATRTSILPRSLSDHGQEKGRVLPRFTKSSSVGNRLGPANAKQQVPIPEPSKSSGNTSSSHQRDVNSSHGNGSVKAGGIFAFMSKNTGGESSASVHTSNDTRTPTYISSSALNQPTTLATRDAPSPPPSATPGVEGDANIASSNNGAMITMAEVETMLGGLRASLSSIQESRAKYKKLLAERDAKITEMHAQVTTLEKKNADLGQRLKSTEELLGTQQAATQKAKAEAAAAEQQAAKMGKDLEEARSQMAQKQVVWAQQQQALQTQIKELRDAAAAQAKARAAPAVAPATPRQTQSQQPSPPQQRASPTAPPPPKAVNKITLQYKTGWRQCYLHCNIDGKGWTNVPGIAFGNSSDDTKVVEVQGTRIEFVTTNGQGGWDGPAPDRNYHVQSPGTYLLHNGQIRRL